MTKLPKFIINLDRDTSNVAVKLAKLGYQDCSGSRLNRDWNLTGETRVATYNDRAAKPGRCFRGPDWPTYDDVLFTQGEFLRVF